MGDTPQGQMAQESEAPDLVPVEAGKVLNLYANGVQFRVGVYDFQLDFILLKGPEAEAPRIPLTSVHLSPQLAKVRKSVV